MKRSKLYRMRLRDNGVWYYRTAGEGHWRSTGERDQLRAAEIVKAALEGGVQPTLRDYAAGFFALATCPHHGRLQEEGRGYTARSARIHRRWKERFIMTDPIAELRIDRIKRVDVIEFRRRVLAATGRPPTTNKVLLVLKVILAEAEYEQRIPESPAFKVARVKAPKREKGTFTLEELRVMFGPGAPWKDLQERAAFTLAAFCGMRRSEILALQWGDVDLEAGSIEVRRAWKSEDDSELGPPKSGKPRRVALPAVAAEALRALGRQLPGALVLAQPDGRRLSPTWWTLRFQGLMERHGIDYRGRNATAHSFRHSLHELLRDAGIPDKRLRASMGWSSEQVQDIYSHDSDTALRRQREALDDLLS